MCVCVCVTPKYSTTSIAFVINIITLQLCPHCSNVWILHPVRPFLPLNLHAHAPTPEQGPPMERACDRTRRWNDRRGALTCQLSVKNATSSLLCCAPTPQVRRSEALSPVCGAWVRGCVRSCVPVCVGGGGGYYRFYQVFPVGPVWPHWRPRVGLLPTMAGPQCRPGVRPCIAPRPVRYAFRPEPGSLPQDHPGSGVVAPWLPPGQLHGIGSTSLSAPCCPVCCVCIGGFTAGGARGSEAASTAYSIWRFPQEGCSWLPPPASRHARSGDRSHDLSVARPTPSPLQLGGDPVCVCVCVCVCVSVTVTRHSHACPLS